MGELTLTRVTVIGSGGGAGVGGGDASAVTYTPAVLTDWNGGVDPGNQDDVNDQLAERAEMTELLAWLAGGIP